MSALYVHTDFNAFSFFVYLEVYKEPGMTEEDYAKIVKKAIHKSRIRTSNNKQRMRKQEEKASAAKEKQISYFHYP